MVTTITAACIPADIIVFIIIDRLNKIGTDL